MPMFFSKLSLRTGKIAFNPRQSSARGGINHPVLLCITKAAAISREPRLFHLIGEAGVGRQIEGSPARAGDGSIALVAIDGRAALEIDPGRDSDDPAVQIKMRGLVAREVVMDSRSPPRSASRYADIRTGPVGDDVRRPIDRSNTEVGSKRRGVYR